MEDHAKHAQNQWNEIVSISTRAFHYGSRCQIIFIGSAFIECIDTADPVAIFLSQMPVPLVWVLPAYKIPHKISPVHVPKLVMPEISNVVSKIGFALTSSG